MASLRKRGGIWHVDFRFRGRRARISTHTDNRKIALRIRHDIEGKIARGIFNLEEYEKKEILLSEFIRRYLEGAKSIKAGSTLSLERIYLRHLMESVGDCDLRSIGAEKLDTWKSRRLQKINATTFNMERRTLHAIFNNAKRWEYIEVNPFAEIRKMKEEERRLYMSESEISGFFAAIHAEMRTARSAYRRKLALLGLFFEFLLNTGLRREEGLRLRIQNIDLADGVIHVTKTKDKEERTIPLTNRAMEILNVVGDSVFTSLRKQYVSHQFKHFSRSAGLEGFKLHSLRHTFSVRLIESGADILVLSKLLGHADIKTSMVYAKAGNAVKRKAIERLEEFQNGHKMVTIELPAGVGEKNTNG